jgi:hypothetical protein
MGGGGVAGGVSSVSLRGAGWETSGRELDSPPFESLCGLVSSVASGRGLDGAGGGKGRVAEGASGISPGFCWVQAGVSSRSANATTTIPLPLNIGETLFTFRAESLL